MAHTYNNHTGDNSTIVFGFTFPYLDQDHVKVYVDEVLKTYVTDWTFASATQVQFVTAPATGAKIRIARETDVLSPEATFYAGSSVRHTDLNDNQSQALYSIDEIKEVIWNKTLDTISSTETWVSNDDKVATTAATDARIDTKIDTALTTDVVAGTDISIDDNTPSSGQITINHNVTGANTTVTNSNGNVLQDITVTAQGHVTSVGSTDLDSRYYTEAELDAGQLDNRYFTETESDARYFRQDSSETISSGNTWTGSDAFVATTAAIDARVIDLVDDVGGFVPIANETSFPATNPDVNDGAGTIISVANIGTTRTPSGGTVTIANGSGSNTVTINGCGSTVLSAGYGMLVETTTTLHTYTFHRLSPKSTEVTTVASISSDITTVAGIEADVQTVASNDANVTTVAGSITNVNSVATSINNVNTVASNINSVNSFSDVYRIASSDPTTSLDVGDLVFNTSSNELRVYNGTAWQAGVTATGNLVSKSGDSMTGNLDMTSNKVTNLATPTDTGDAANKAYVDANADLVSDTTPQLGGNLDVNGHEITSTSNGDIVLNPDGTGVVVVDEIRSGAGSINADLVLGTVGTGRILLANGGIKPKNNNTNLFLSATGTGVIDFNTFPLTHVGDPTNAQDAATKNYVDTQLAGISADSITEGNTSAEVVDTGTDGHFKVTTEGTERLRVISDGSVGIGTDSPSANLHVRNPNASAASITLQSLNSTHGTSIGFLQGNDIRALINTEPGSNNLVLDPVGTGTVDVSSARITSVADPTGAQDAATKNYVDTNAGGASGGGTDQVFYENDQTVNTSYSITLNHNAMSAGPITIGASATVTIPSGSTWVIV